MLRSRRLTLAWTGLLLLAPVISEVIAQRPGGFGRRITLGPEDVAAFADPPVGFDTARADIPHGELELVTYESKSVGTTRKMNVYTPPGYTQDTKYPVLNLLHGIGGAAGESEASNAPVRRWTADNGNGTYSNPLFYEEFEDPDVIRVGDDYYLAGTTMHMNPGVQVMHSRDLVNWELASYCIDRLDLGPAFRLEGGNIYGQGIWAPCIRFHDGMFYVFSNVNGVGLQVFRSKSAYGPWERNQLPGRHDLSVLFDDDGKVYLISGNRSPYPIEELSPDLRSFVADAPRRYLNERMGEGHHLYKINGKYVDVSAIPGGAVDQMVAVADSIDGPWKVTRMVEGESLGVTAATPALADADDRGLWLHQGGIVDTPSGEWWSIIMSDHGSAGRMVNLVPVTWDDGFPLIGLPGNLRKAPNTWIKPDTGCVQAPQPAFIHDDNFDSGKLSSDWQWNHVPDDNRWSLTEKPGVLRLHSLPADDFYSARNSLCQRPPGPESTMTVEMNTSGMVAGDTAGLALLSAPYAWIGVVRSAEGATLQMYNSPSRRRGFGSRRPEGTPTNEPVVSPTAPPEHLWLRVHCDFDTDQAVFSWSADGKEFTPVGSPFTMTFQLTTFQGVRPSLFHYNTSAQAGGHVDFDNYTVDEPRARGTEREIPVGKAIVLTSGADGTLLAADLESSTLVNVPADHDAAANAEFHVIDQGLGRVAFKAGNGRFVSVPDPETVILEDLAGAEPGDAETFQWINLMRGDTMLMSLTNHRYLATKPASPGRVTATATGPNPARKGGACFKWQEVGTSAAESPSRAGQSLGVNVVGSDYQTTHAQATGGATAKLDAAKPPIATPLKWKSSGVLVRPVSDESHTIVSVKDPTVVHFGGLWHIYATAYSTSARTWSMVYLNFENWSEASRAKLTYIDVNPSLKGYHCAPYLFYFTPHEKWYLVFQSQQPQYCTTNDISKPETWTAPQNFFERLPASTPRLPIDYHVICDDTHAYLFFTGDDGRFYRSRTRIEDFPAGMSDPEIAIQDDRNRLFEGSMTYKIKGTDTYLTIIEALSPARYYRAWISDDLNGQWTPLAGADSWETPFAGINNVTFADGVEPWTRDISHGELLRENYDQTPTIDPENLRFLFQGRDPQSGGRYELLPYQLGLLELVRSGQSNDAPTEPAAEPTAAIGLKEAYAGKFLIGAAGDLRGYSDAELANIKANYDVMTPENCMKPQPIHPAEGRYDWSVADAMVQWCQDNNIQVWGHTLLWHSQTGRWFFEPAPDGESVTRELAMARLKDHITTVVGRYKGRVRGWDVVNEAIDDRGTGRTENLRDHSWYRNVGPDVLTMAFQWARQADPDAELYYNDYGIEQGAARNTGKHASSILLLKRLIDEGAPIDGVGIQGHWTVNTNLEDIEKAITNYASLGLKVAISELDVAVIGSSSGAFPGREFGRGRGFGFRPEPVSADALKRQADFYAGLFEVLKRHSDTISRVTFWGISDRRSWRSRQSPLLFDRELQPKPAYQAILDVGLGRNSTLRNSDEETN